VSPQVTRASDDPDRPGGSEPAPEDSPAAVATTPGPSAVSAGVAAEGGANPPEDPARLVGQPQVEDSGPGTGETAVDEPVPADDFHLTLLVETGSPQPGARLARLTRDMHRVGAKPVEVLGRHVYADGSRRFEVLRESMGYDALCLRLLLVNRQGPVNAMEYSEFASHAQRLNEDLEVLVDLPDMSDVLARARELDETIGPLDAQMAVNVEVPATLSPDEFSRIALRLGLHEQTSQRFARIDRHGEPLFTAALTEKAGRILLLLDVPRARSEGQPIREVVETAWKFAQAFEGRMVDDAGNPIDNALFERIENQLETLYHALDAHGLPAGSPLARRVFNL
jgi:hypothetical protein